MTSRSPPPWTTGPTCLPRCSSTGPTWRSSTSGCRRPSPTRGCAPHWRPGGRVVDPGVLARLLPRRPRDEPMTQLSPREREVLELMAEGRSNSAIAQHMFVSEKAVSKHSSSIFTKLGLAQSDDDNRRVLAVLAYLNS